MRRAKKKRRQFVCVATALSVLVSGSVFWQLRGIGTAMVDANLPAADDSGGEGSMEQLASSEPETPDIWEATLPPLTDSAGENVARIAESQLGYTESSVNFVHAEDGETHSGYTRYGAWYGNPYGDWNTMFTYFCMDYAGVAPDDVPYGSGCWAWSLVLDKAGLIAPVTRGSPQRGDILLLDYDADGKADRSCIVSRAGEDELAVIEGDIDGCVAEQVYFPSDERLVGMVSLDGLAADPPVLPDEPVQLDFTAESESGIRVEAHADQGAFPFGAVMSVFDISRDEAIQTAAEQLGEDVGNVDAVAVDITFTAPDGSELEPAEDSQVSVSIALPDEQALSDGEFLLLHVSDDGDVQEVADADVSADGADFTAESFSMWVLTSSGYQEPNVLITVNGQSVPNSESTPYVMYVGDSFTLKSQALAHSNGSDGNGWQYGYDDSVISASETYPYNETINEVEYRIHEKTYTAISPGTTNIRVVAGENWQTDYFYVKVIERPQIYVNTALGERHKDYLHEYLDIHAQKFANYKYQYFILDENENALYIKNGDVRYDPVKFADPNHDVYDTGEDGAFLPYRVSSGDIIEVITYCSPSEADTLDFSVGTSGSHQEGENILEKVGASDKQLVTSGEHAGEYRISSKFRAKTTAGTKRTGIRLGPDFFYIVVNDNGDDIKTHADIEIDDGGKYVFERYSFDSDGNLVKTIEEYSAFVSDINYCRIYDSNGDPLKFQASTAEDKSHEGQNVEFVSTTTSITTFRVKHSMS